MRGVGGVVQQNKEKEVVENSETKAVNLKPISETCLREYCCPDRSCCLLTLNRRHWSLEQPKGLSGA